MGNSDHGITYMRVGGDDGELRPWHYIYVYSIESRLIRRVIYANGNPNQGRCDYSAVVHLTTKGADFHRGDLAFHH